MVNAGIEDYYISFIVLEDVLNITYLLGVKYYPVKIFFNSSIY